MAEFRMHISMSLDGCVAGPNQSLDDPLGVGGERLHDWAIPLKAFREAHGQEGGEVNESDAVVREVTANIGATVMGRNMFGPVRGEWRTDAPWDGWWGRKPPFGHPVYVLTHHPRPPLELEGTTFHFVTSGFESAMMQAMRAAGGRDVAVAGGASTVRQALLAKMIDVMDIHLVPIFLGPGERIFDGEAELRGFKHVRTIAALGVTHFSFVRE
jgi:dihydrofolate reductase